MGIIGFETPPKPKEKVGGMVPFFFFFKYQLEALDVPLWGKKEGRRREQSPSFALAGSLSRAEVGELPAAFWVWGH